MQDVEVIESAEAAATALDPVRARLLGELAVPASAAGLAGRVGIARQKINYHLKALEAHGLVALSEERRHGGIIERVLQASAASYVVSPAAVTSCSALRYCVGRPHRCRCSLPSNSFSFFYPESRVGFVIPLRVQTHIGSPAP